MTQREDGALHKLLTNHDACVRAQWAALDHANQRRAAILELRDPRIGWSWRRIARTLDVEPQNAIDMAFPEHV